MNSKYILYTSILTLIVLTIVFSNIPFFWDGTYFSKAATFFYTNYNSFFDCGMYTDNTTLPIYSGYLSLIWKLFSKSLLVSHLAVLPFLIFLIYEFYKFSRRYLNETYSSFSLLLLLAEPTFITQSILMGYDILMTFLFIFLLNRLLDNKLKTFAIILPVLSLYSIRALVLAVSLFFIHIAIEFYRNKKINLFLILKWYIPTIIVVMAWFVYHKIQTGWYIFSPLHENTDEHFVSLSMVIRQFFYVLWKLADFGRIVLWGTVFIYLIYFYTSKKQNKTNPGSLFSVLFIPTIISMVFMVVVSNPIGHKYFIFSYLILIVSFCWVLQQFKNKLAGYFLLFFSLIVLMLGNFIMYPQKYGNGWDSSLKILPFFELKDQMDNFIANNNIESKDVGTQFPLTADMRYSHLETDSVHYSDVLDVPFNNFNYALLSNVINTDRSGEFEKIKKEWILIKELKSGQVNLELYKNPNR